MSVVAVTGHLYAPSTTIVYAQELISNSNRLCNSYLGSKQPEVIRYNAAPQYCSLVESTTLVDPSTAPTSFTIALASPREGDVGQIKYFIMSTAPPSRRRRVDRARRPCGASRLLRCLRSTTRQPTCRGWQRVEYSGVDGRWRRRLWHSLECRRRNGDGFRGHVDTPTTTPVIHVQTNVTGIMKGDGTAASAAIAGVDYTNGLSGLGGGIVYVNSAGIARIATGSDFPSPLNVSITGNAATVTTNAPMTVAEVYTSAPNVLSIHPASIDLTTKVTNVLPIANGGTNASSLAANGILGGKSRWNRSDFKCRHGWPVSWQRRWRSDVDQRR